MLRIEGLTKYFGRFRALGDVSFTVERGSSLLLLGPNGAGKTTIIKCVMGLLRYKGSIYFDGQDIAKDGVDVRTKIGYVPQQTAFYENLSVYDQAKFVSRLKGSRNEDIQRRLEEVDLWQVKRQKVKSLSSGMKQRLGIALALLHEPAFLIFDEPTGNVDMRGQLEFQSTLEKLAKEGRTMLITTHFSGLEGNVSDAVVLNNGRVVASGKPAALLQRVKSLHVIHTRVPGADFEKAIALLNTNGASGVTRRGEWIEFYTEASKKAPIINQLLTGGVRVEDLVIEPPEIGAEYLKLLSEETSK